MSRSGRRTDGGDRCQPLTGSEAGLGSWAWVGERAGGGGGNGVVLVEPRVVSTGAGDTDYIPGELDLILFVFPSCCSSIQLFFSLGADKHTV